MQIEITKYTGVYCVVDENGDRWIQDVNGNEQYIGKAKNVPQLIDAFVAAIKKPIREVIVGAVATCQNIKINLN